MRPSPKRRAHGNRLLSTGAPRIVRHVEDHVSLLDRLTRHRWPNGAGDALRRETGVPFLKAMEKSPPRIGDREKIRALPWALSSGMLNAVFALWTFGGSVFVLFLRELGLPLGQIGVLLSLFPFCGLIALGFAPMAARLGRKRTFIACYGARKWVMALLLLLPGVSFTCGHSAAILFLAGVIVVFALLRALAETAWYPWTQEYVPNHVRGKFSAWSAALGIVASSAALAIAGVVLDRSVGLGRFLWLIGAGSALGFIGVLLMAKVPGGAPVTPSAGGLTHRAGMAAAMRDRNFVNYLVGVAGQTIGMAMLASFLPLFLRDQIGVSAATVVRLDMLAMVGGALASLGLGWLSDRIGSRPILMPALALLALLPLGWLWLPREASQALIGVGVLYVLYGVASHSVLLGAGRLLNNDVAPRDKSTAYMAIYYAWLGLAGGIAPLLAGGVLATCADGRLARFGVGRDGYSVMFALALVFLAAGWFFFGRVRPDGPHTTRTAVRGFMNRIAQR